MYAQARWPQGSFRRLAHAVGLTFAQAAILFVVGLGLIGGAVLGDVDPFSAPPAVFYLLVPLTITEAGLVVWVGLLKIGRVTLRELGWRFEPVDIGYGLAGLLGCLGIVAGVIVASGGTLSDAVAQVRGFTVEQRVLFLIIGVHAAFTEETLFRGYLQPTLVSRLGLPLGIVVMAVIFALYHLNFRPLPLLGKFLTGLLLGAMRQRDQSLFRPAIAHGLFWCVAGAL